MKISFLGGGNMAAALIGGLVEQGFEPARLQVCELQEAARQRLGQQFGVRCVAAPDADFLSADCVVLAVKPQQMRQALLALAGQFGRQLVISIAAGIRLADIERWLGGYARVVRAMPNTPALVGAGITGLCADPTVVFGERVAAEQVLGAVGSTLWIEDEAMMDAVTAVSGSGPAYVFHFIESLQAAAQALGFAPEQARRLSIETFVGATRLAAASTEDVAALRARVTSPGGTTEAALRTLDTRGVKDAIAAAVQAAQQRGRELGEQLSKD
jgi:pyrroline-5-carboxylate reductase